MPAPTGAFVIRDALVTVATVEYNNQCTKAVLTPDTPVQSLRTLVPDGAVVDVDSPLWTFDITALQINQTGGLAKALRDATLGSTLAVILAPQNASGKFKASFNIIAMPPRFGGDQGAFATIEMSFPVLGAPVFTALP